MIYAQEKLMLITTFNMATTQSNCRNFATFHKFKCKAKYQWILVSFFIFIIAHLPGASAEFEFMFTASEGNGSGGSGDEETTGGGGSDAGDDLSSGEVALIVISCMAVGGFLLSLVGYAVYKHIQWSGLASSRSAGPTGTPMRYQTDYSYHNESFEPPRTDENFGYDQESDSYQNQTFGVLQVNTD